MKRIVTHLSLLAATAILATGCVPVRHNLPPEQQMMEPGPGVGGPGPGVLGPPAMAPGMMGNPMMGNPMMGNPMMGGPAMGAGALMQSGMPAQGYSPAMPQPLGTSASLGEGELDLVNYTCGPGCTSCGGSGGCLSGGGGGGLLAAATLDSAPTFLREAA